MKGVSIYSGSSVDEGAKAIITDIDKRWSSLPVDNSIQEASTLTKEEKDFVSRVGLAILAEQEKEKVQLSLSPEEQDKA